VSFLAARNNYAAGRPITGLLGEIRSVKNKWNKATLRDLPFFPKSQNAGRGIVTGWLPVTPYSGATCKAQDTLIINTFGPMKGVFRVFSPRTSRIRVAPSSKTRFFGSDVRFLYEGNRIRIGATVS
jgi:hypothetical protein